MIWFCRLAYAFSALFQVVVQNCVLKLELKSNEKNCVSELVRWFEVQGTPYFAWKYWLGKWKGQGCNGWKQWNSDFRQKKSEIELEIRTVYKIELEIWHFHFYGLSMGLCNPAETHVSVCTKAVIIATEISTKIYTITIVVVRRIQNKTSANLKNDNLKKHD